MMPPRAFGAGGLHDRDLLERIRHVRHARDHLQRNAQLVSVHVTLHVQGLQLLQLVQDAGARARTDCQAGGVFWRAQLRVAARSAHPMAAMRRRAEGAANFFEKRGERSARNASRAPAPPATTLNRNREGPPPRQAHPCAPARAMRQ